MLKQQTELAVAAAIATPAASNKVSAKLPPSDLQDRAWMLHQYIEIAAELGLIGADTAEACRRAKLYRNLIHPAVAERKSVVSSRGAAHIAIGAAYEVIRELEA